MSIVTTPHPTTRFERLLLIGAAALLAITAWYSTGYHSEDEHHQTIGFAEAWLGELPANEHAWEYDARIRGTALPWIAVGMFKATEALGITDPFSKALLLRLLTAVLAISVTSRFLRAMRDHVPAALWKPFLVITWSLWFLPFLHVRFASETWSGLVMLLGLATTLDPTRGRWWPVGAGACIALAIWIRPPVALIAAGLVLWLILVRKEGWRNLLTLVASGATVILLTLVADSLFYGTPTCSVLRCIRTVIIGDPDHPFDALPWYYYAPWVFKYAIPPIGACILVAVGVLLWKEPMHVLVWCILPFVIVHTFIPHKEVRFMYPLAELVPWLLVAGFEALQKLMRVRRGVVIAGCAIVVVCNALGLIVVTTNPAGNGRADLARAVRSHDPPSPIHIAYLSTREEAWRIVLPHFYRPDGAEATYIDPAHGSDPSTASSYVIAYRHDLWNGASADVPHSPHWASSGPGWSVPLLHAYYWGEWKGQLELHGMSDR